MRLPRLPLPLASTATLHHRSPAWKRQGPRVRKRPGAGTTTTGSRYATDPLPVPTRPGTGMHSTKMRYVTDRRAVAMLAKHGRAGVRRPKTTSQSYISRLTSLLPSSHFGVRHAAGAPLNACFIFRLSSPDGPVPTFAAIPRPAIDSGSSQETGLLEHRRPTESARGHPQPKTRPTRRRLYQEPPTAKCSANSRRRATPQRSFGILTCSPKPASLPACPGIRRRRSKSAPRPEAQRPQHRPRGRQLPLHLRRSAGRSHILGPPR